MGTPENPHHLIAIGALWLLGAGCDAVRGVVPIAEAHSGRPTIRADAGPPPADALDHPRRLRVEYRQITHFPTCRGNRRILIEPDGRVFTSRNTSDCPPGTHFSTPYPIRPVRVVAASRMQSLRDLVERADFAALAAAPAPAKAAATDGYLEEIEVQEDGRRVQIDCEGSAAPQPAFARVRDAVQAFAR